MNFLFEEAEDTLSKQPRLRHTDPLYTDFDGIETYPDTHYLLSLHSITYRGNFTRIKVKVFKCQNKVTKNKILLADKKLFMKLVCLVSQFTM